ncbi:T9SS type A sorting domain-containing protein [Aequorivita antarctica]|uniref:T9SS type A sorting domain-containing protein n=1 Tax=Aequorivita antarctica TaxID=153266 RepID=A0A5C6Z0Q3_9FLAO|nr:T9SS type A sorting domain-containing protein [Aequorivita antarctica]TXD73040.1 T9SS type A sorting domain-containing protein [Aequorivita antarctica]SRX74553.1 hypothetical protein AEQU3_01532 [Aequorivita antarctica]
MKTTITKILLSLTLLFIINTVANASTNHSMLVPPSNDLIENAIDIDLGPFPYSELAVNFPDATSTNDTPGGACGVAAAAVWYKFTAVSSASVAAVMVSPQSSIVIFFSAPNENVTLATQLTYVEQGSNPCGNGNSSTIETTAGTTYYVLMKNNIISDVLININAALVPGNDLIENAINVADGPYPYTESSVQFNHATFTNDATDGDCSVANAGIWYKFTARAAGNVEATILNNTAVPYVVFFSAPNENVTNGLELTFENQSGNDCSLGPVSSIDVTAGTTYYIYMKNGLAANVLININPALVPNNDLIENATNLNGIEEYQDLDVIFAAATTTNDGGQTGCNTDPARAVWYKFTAAVDGQVQAEIGFIPGAGGVIFYTAADENVTTASELTWVDQPENICGPNTFSSINATAGTTYYLFAALVDGFERANVSVDLSGILSIDENTFQDFTYYPNPVTNELNLSAKTNIDEVSIFNLMGQKVFSQKINATKKSINLSHLQTGIYVMKVNAEGSSATYKIVKQ